MLKELPSRAVSGVHAIRENPFVREFKDFALKGNIMDLAIGIMVGGAFNKIVSSLVNDVIMPPLGVVLGRMDFGNFFIDLSGKGYKTVADAKAAGAATLNYGLFINNVIDFLIIALITFLIVRQINAWRRTDEAQAAPAEKDCPFCLSHIPLAATRCPHCTSQFA